MPGVPSNAAYRKNSSVLEGVEMPNIDQQKRKSSMNQYLHYMVASIHSSHVKNSDVK